jgi:hypothetical protein
MTSDSTEWLDRSSSVGRARFEYSEQRDIYFETMYLPARVNKYRQAQQRQMIRFILGSPNLRRLPMEDSFVHKGFTVREQLLPHARPAVFALDLRVNPLDVRKQCVVTHAASVRLDLRGALPALMISTGTDFQHFA